jgi:WhiB family redox-sensing transcriptional regulator
VSELLGEPADWTARAACTSHDPDMFFPLPTQSAASAVAVCRQCAVVDECLDFAIAHGERFGVWGGRRATDRGELLEQIPIDDTPDDTSFAEGDDFTYDPGEFA